MAAQNMVNGMGSLNGALGQPPSSIPAAPTNGVPLQTAPGPQSGASPIDPNVLATHIQNAVTHAAHTGFQAGQQSTQGQGGAAPGMPIIAPNDKSAYQQLPAGTPFMYNGQQYVKPGG